MEIKSTVIKQGTGYGFRIPKALVDCKVIDPDKEYIFEVRECGNWALAPPTHNQVMA